MTRATISLAAAVLLGILAVAPAGAAPAASRARLSHFVCRPALDPPARAVSVTATMRPLPGTQGLQMRMALLHRLAHGSFRAVAVPRGSKLGSWIEPGDRTLGRRPGDIWMVQFPVADLPAPADYRYRAQFRWLGRGGRVLATVQQASPVCFQPERRPDLLVRSLSVRPVAGHPNFDRYVALIGNRGATGARAVEVRFTDAGEVQVRTVARMPPHSSLTLRFLGLACAASAPPTLVLDPQRRVDDYDRADNTARATCPRSPSSMFRTPR